MNQYSATSPDSPTTLTSTRACPPFTSGQPYSTDLQLSIGTYAGALTILANRSSGPVVRWFDGDANLNTTAIPPSFSSFAFIASIWIFTTCCGDSPGEGSGPGCVAAAAVTAVVPPLPASALG